MEIVKQYNWDTENSVLKITKTEEMTLSPVDVLNDKAELLLEKSRLQERLGKIDSEIQRLENVIDNNTKVFQDAQKALNVPMFIQDEPAGGKGK